MRMRGSICRAAVPRVVGHVRNADLIIEGLIFHLPHPNISAAIEIAVAAMAVVAPNFHPFTFFALPGVAGGSKAIRGGIENICCS